MTSKHTPGPWELQIWKAESKEEIMRWLSDTIDAGTGYSLYRVGCMKPDGEAIVAITGNGPDSINNPRLTAAAPELLEACKETDLKVTALFSSLRMRGIIFTPEEEELAQAFYIKNQAAIAKAEGGLC